MKAWRILAILSLLGCLSLYSFASWFPFKKDNSKNRLRKKETKNISVPDPEKEARSNSKVKLEWLETFVGEIVSMNPNTQRMIIKDVNNGRTKLISINKETVVKKGDSTLPVSDLKLGQSVMVKYEFLEATARVVSIREEKPEEKNQQEVKN